MYMSFYYRYEEQECNDCGFRVEYIYEVFITDTRNRSATTVGSESSMYMKFLLSIRGTEA